MTAPAEPASRALFDALALATAVFAAPFVVQLGIFQPLPERFRLSAQVAFLGVVLVGVALARLHAQLQARVERTRITRRDYLQAFGLTSPRSWGRDVALGGALALAVLLANVALMLLAERLRPAAFQAASEAREESLTTLAAVPLPLALATALFAGIYEELVFRGYLLGRLREALGAGRLRTFFAVAIQAAIFSVGHGWQGPIGVVQSLGIGLLFGALAAWQGVRVGVVAHATIDATSFALIHLIR